MSLAITNKDAWAEVFKFISAENPVMGNDSTQWRPVKLEKHSTDEKVLRLVVASNNPATVNGTLTVEYSAADLGKYVNVYGDVTRPPEVYFFGDVGKKYKLSDILPLVNSVVGLQLNTDGAYPDIEDQEFTAPLKDATLTMTLTPKPIPAGGSAYFPMRLIGTKKAVINIINRGSHIGTAMAVRSVNPFVTPERELVWNGERQLVDEPKHSYLPGLTKLDFTDIFGTPSMINEAFNAGGANLGNYVYAAVLNDKVRALINAKLAVVGIPPITRADGVVDSLTRYANKIVKADRMEIYDSQCQATFGDLTKSFYGRHFQYFGASGDRNGKAPKWIRDNVDKRYFIRIAPPGYTGKDNSMSDLSDYNVATDKNEMLKRPFYLFFNDLTA